MAPPLDFSLTDELRMAWPDAAASEGVFAANCESDRVVLSKDGWKVTLKYKRLSGRPRDRWRLSFADLPNHKVIDRLEKILVASGARPLDESMWWPLTDPAHALTEQGMSFLFRGSDEAMSVFREAMKKDHRLRIVDRDSRDDPRRYFFRHRMPVPVLSLETGPVKLPGCDQIGTWTFILMYSNDLKQASLDVPPILLEKASKCGCVAIIIAGRMC